MTDVCGLLILQVGVALRRTVIGCDGRLWFVDRPGWCSPEKNCCRLLLTLFCGLLIVQVGVVLRRSVVGCD